MTVKEMEAIYLTKDVFCLNKKFMWACLDCHLCKSKPCHISLLLYEHFMACKGICVCSIALCFATRKALYVLYLKQEGKAVRMAHMPTGTGKLQFCTHINPPRTTGMKVLIKIMAF